MTQILSPLAELLSSIAGLSDDALLGTVERLAQSENEATAQLVGSLAELDARRLYRDAGYSSLFTFCTQRLHLSEHAAYRRIEAARAARRFPLILDRLSEGAVTLTAIGLVAELLTPQNYVELLDRIRHQSKRTIELLVAELAPKPDAPASVRRLPEPSRSATSSNSSLPTSTPKCVSRTDQNAGAPVSSAAADGDGSGPSRADVACTAGTHASDERHGGQVDSAVESAPDAAQPDFESSCSTLSPTIVLDTPHASAGSVGRKPHATVVPTAPDRYRVQMTISGDTCAKLRRAQDLMRHVVPDGDLATVFDCALTLLVADLEKTRMAAISHCGSERAAISARTGHKRATPGTRSDSERATTDAHVSTTGCRSGHVPAAVKRSVWARDEARCTFEGPHGRCTETGMLQLHHRVPFAVGGSTDARNLELRCVGHNALDADLFFGRRPVAFSCVLEGET